MDHPKRMYFSALRESASGSAILEAALLLPVLVILLAGAYDGFRAMQAYDTLSEIAQEAVRFAARVAPLEPGTFTSGGGSSGTVPPGHASVHDRIRAIIASKSWHSPLEDVQVSSQLHNGAGTGITGSLGPSDPTLDGVITVRVSGRYRGMFTAFLFSNLMLQITVAAPQL